MTQHRRTLKILVAAIAVLAWIGFIFSHSLQTGSESGSLSGKIVEIVNTYIPILSTWLTSDQIHFLIRKLAHFSEYAILSFWLWLFWVQISTLNVTKLTRHKYQAVAKQTYSLLEYRSIAWQTAQMSCLSGLLVAVADETIQTFVPARAGLVSDVWIDFAGVIFIQILIGLIWYQVKKRKTVGK